MVFLQIYKKDLKKDKTDFIIIRGFENGKKTYYISTRQAVEDFEKTHFFPYEKACYNYQLAKKLLAEIQEQNKKPFEWIIFEYKSGSNPYIAKTEKEKNRILNKYKNNVVEQISNRKFLINDI